MKGEVCSICEGAPVVETIRMEIPYYPISSKLIPFEKVFLCERCRGPDRETDPEYREYLRLRAKFEGY